MSQMNDGTVQKRAILFSNEGQVGQRIVAGIFAAESTSKENSLLAVRDPEPEGLISLGGLATLRLLVRSRSRRSSGV